MNERCVQERDTVEGMGKMYIAEGEEEGECNGGRENRKEGREAWLAYFTLETNSTYLQ